MFGFLTIDQPATPGDAIDRLTGTESNLDARGNEIVVSMDAKYAGAEATISRNTASSSRGSTTGTTNHRYYIANHQHPDNNVAEGKLIIHEIYQAIRKSKYWEKCLFVIVYDEHGGFYDHVPPPRTIPSGLERPGASSFDFKRMGVRVPAVLISPYIAKPLPGSGDGTAAARFPAARVVADIRLGVRGLRRRGPERHTAVNRRCSPRHRRGPEPLPDERSDDPYGAVALG